MIKNIKFDLSEILPGKEAAFKSQGIPPDTEVPPAISMLLEEALNIFSSTARPACILLELSTDEFQPVFEGEGENADDALLKYIYPRADNLALFALTMGKQVSEEIEQLFDKNDFGLASMLDAVASNVADKASKVCEKWFHNYLVERGIAAPGTVVLGYSPGYCGWNISGQKKLFAYLQPEKIGIALNESCLMIPLKSITGLLVSGSREIHLFKDNYSYCRTCRNRSCLERMKQLRSVDKPAE